MPRVGGPVGRPGPKPSSDAVEPWAGMKNSLDQLLLYGFCTSCRGGMAGFYSSVSGGLVEPE